MSAKGPRVSKEQAAILLQFIEQHSYLARASTEFSSLMSASRKNELCEEPRVADAEPNGYVGARVRTDRSCKMTDLSAQHGYDPDAMAWATIPVPEGQQSAAADPIRNEELFRMVECRSQRKTMKMTPSAPPAGKAPSTQTGSTTRAAQGSGAKRSKPTTTWKPKPLPRPHPEDFVVIIKPREPVALRDVFQRGALGAAFATLVGVKKAATRNLLLSLEQNLIIASTREAQTADQLLGDFELQTDKGKMAAHGHLKQHGEDVCYGVVTVANHETTDTLRQALQWPAGELLDIRKFGTSNKARLTIAGRVKPRYIHYNSEITFVQPYYRIIPACGLCGTFGHRADSCPNPANANGGGADPSRVQPKVRGLWRKPRHELARMYSQIQTTQDDHPSSPTKSGKKTRHHAAFSHGGSRHVDATTQQEPPRGVKYGKQVSGPGGAASPFQSPPPPSPTLIAKEIRKHTEPLRAKIANLEAQLSNPPSAPTSPSASNAESMDSEITLPKPSGHDSFESVEARLSAKMELLISTTMGQMLAKVDELITSKVNQAVAAQLRTLRKAGPLRDVSGRPSKFSRRIVDIDDDEDCTPGRPRCQNSGPAYWLWGSSTHS
ncbi:hypothetical protein HPB49_012422 [Dermacentor silvarum]|uniref:Uncharacterized protein n=1 Tax=Dermacentor silvarum TaxID=543639 RepID=A0ACB8DPG3_DERSI|nr:hypothetical protein HPB49_012422 [Dermacentor silvarum]